MEIDKTVDRLLAFFKSKEVVEKISIKSEEVELPKKTEHYGNRKTFLKINIDMESQFYQMNILKLFLKWKVHLVVFHNYENAPDFSLALPSRKIFRSF